MIITKVVLADKQPQDVLAYWQQLAPEICS